MTSTIRTDLGARLAGLTLAAALATTGAVAVAPTAALAVPAGGYGDLVEAVSPAVVFIEVSTEAKPASFDDDRMEELKRRFGGQIPGMPGMPGGEGVRQGVGSGFIISEDGDIVTNNHVVEGADTVTVKLSDGRSLKAEVVGTDPATDLALLKVEADAPLPSVKLGDSSVIRAGDEVVAVGNPFGLGGTVTSGIVSATSRDIRSGPYDDFIQTDAAINRGNSGGPLFNNAGEVIGVNTAIFSPDGGSVGIGFAVPSQIVTKVVADLKDDGTIDRGWLGVQIRPMSDEVAGVLGFDKPKGAVVEKVSADSPAQKAGLKDDDIILQFGEAEITDLRDLTRAVADTAPDSATSVKVLRKGKEITLDVTVGNLASQKT
ncbi:trypsin [Brevirhabdus pacifica]|uniref:Probable periplasmic serine endoprotease DegP-like n=1 Tax=Brevirhabdus pacifica TaxID=1267768 RepID=A0A1U7DGE8_9RHOB|nr:trypsin-like peptidase domain-containing protein [Brevirhabdus pacifica]APX89074.1 trypsin [Brevirhabdus pacifica]OWU76863.1 trypsin [Loktanella sp. 22II-4b]PJJ86348.1 serine protease Do [Brevirhabdus pacifica]